MKFDKITSDLHFGHVNISTYCPQRRDYLDMGADGGVVEMTAGLVRIWNAQVEMTDNVLVVGDLAMGKILDTLQIVPHLNGQIWLVPGNHDRMFSGECKTAEKAARWRGEYESVGIAVLDEIFIGEFDGVTALVCHFPYSGDHGETDRYESSRPFDEGLPLVHGHIHDAWATRGREFNVGIDAWNGEFLTPEKIGAYFRSIGF